MSRSADNSSHMFIAGLAVALLVACSDPRCPRDMVQNGKMCRACEPGFVAQDNICRLADASEDGGATPVDADAMPGGDEGLDSAVEAAVGCSPQPEVCGNLIDDDCDLSIDEASEAAESCNGVDDDCDGEADEGLLIRREQYDLWPQEVAAPTMSQIRVVPNGAGGAWLLYRAGVLMNLQDEERRPINMVGIGPDGRPAGHVVAAQQATAGTTRFVADGDDKWVVTFAREVPSSPNHSWQYLFVRMFTADSLAPLGEFRVDYRDNRNYGTFLAPLAVSAFEDVQGVVHVLVAYEADTQGSGVWGTSLRLAHVRRAPSGLWTAGTSYTLFAAPLGAASVRIARIPCRDEWAVATASSTVRSDSRLAIYTPAGSGNREIGVLADTERIDAIGTHTDGCASDPELVLAHSSYRGNTRLSRWAVDQRDGVLTADENTVSLGMPLNGAALQHRGGSWFVAGAGSDSTFTLLRATFQDDPRVEFLRLISPTGPNPGALLDGQYSQLADVISLRDEIYTVAANSFRESNLTELLPSTGQGLAQAAAVTFHIGCH